MIGKFRWRNPFEVELRLQLDQIAERTNRSLNESEVCDAERLARLMDLKARVSRRRKFGRFVWVAILLAGLVAATFKQPHAEVRITLEATAGQIVMGADKQIGLGISGEKITLTGFVVDRAPAELNSVVQPGIDGNKSLQAVMPNLALQSINVLQGTELQISADVEEVSFRLGCADVCAGGEVRLAVRGELRSDSALATVEALSSIDFLPRTAQPIIHLFRRDSTSIPLVEWLPVESASFQRFLDNGGAHSLDTLSAIYSGVVTLPAYPARSRALARGAELYVAGSALRLSAVERRDDRLVFRLDGKASDLLLGREDLRPSWWDWVRTHPYWEILVGFLGALSAMLLFAGAISGRS